MNKNYREYSFEDFSRDESFRQWVLNPDNNNDELWKKWVSENPDCAENVNIAKAFLLTLQQKDVLLNNDDLELITDQIVEESPLSIPFWRNTAYKIAASILLIISIGFFGLKFYFQESDNMTTGKITQNLSSNFVEEENNSTEKKQIILEDGSQITLYKKSQIRYPKQFSAQIREVYLIGQAFFKVTKNPKRPFWVYTNYISTQVLGTSFMVKALENEKNIKVEVHSGRVSVYRREDLEKAKIQQKNELIGIILTPNQEVDYSITDARLLKSIISQPEVLVENSPNHFNFDETPIKEVFGILEKTYGINIIFDEKNMENCFLNASFSDESLYDKLKLICKITHSTFEIVDAQIIIHSKGC
jgi:hypothetical protein